MRTEVTDSDQGHGHFEQRLRGELGHLTVRVPADMIPRAHRRYRRRLVTMRVTAIAGTAAVIASAATVVAMAGPSLGLVHDRQRPGAATNQPSSRIPVVTLKPPAPGDNLTAHQAARDISWIRRAASTPGSGVSDVSDVFSYGGTARTIGFSGKGTVVPVAYDARASIVTGAGGTRVEVSTDVSYPTKSVVRGTRPAPRQARQPAVCPAARGSG